MKKYAVGALALDPRNKIEEQLHARLQENLERFSKAPLESEPDFPQMEALPEKIEAAFRRHPLDTRSIEERVATFSLVSSLVTADCGEAASTSGQPLSDYLLEAPALFEAVALEYWDSGHLLVNDEIFNVRLKLLIPLEAAGVPRRSQTLIGQYFRGMDLLLAHDFWRTHHRHSDMVRMGPFSVSNGDRGERYIERPAVVLDEEQRNEFGFRAWRSLSHSPLNPGDPDFTPFLAKQVEMYVSKVGSEPRAAVFFEG